jgi:hypothetical protein
MNSVKQWKIVQLECVNDTAIDRVILAHWTLTVSFEGEEVSSYGFTKLESTDNTSYIPYLELTENDVVDWVKEALGEKVNDMELALEKQLAEWLAPSVVVPPLPWNN